RVTTVHPRVAAAQILVSGLLAAALPFLLSTKPTFGLFTSGLIVGFLLTRQKVPGVGNGARRLAVLGCGFSTLVGVASIEAIASHAWLETYLPGPLPLMAYAAALGGFVVLGVGAAHLTAPTDPVKTHYRAKAPELRGELRDVARRAEETYRATTAVLTARAGDRAEALRLQERLATVTHRVLDLAARCQALRAAVGDETELRLAKEIAELERKAQATSDEIAKSHYERAQSTLAAQHAQLERIRMGRDRALATMHSQLALLERARLSLIGLQSSDTSRLTAELCLLSESLDEASNAMDAETEAILVVTASA
ncbi:MAG: hypothetical protein ACOC0J_00505, partial [Myxococcota bacterium]